MKKMFVTSFNNPLVGTMLKKKYISENKRKKKEIQEKKNYINMQLNMWIRGP